MDAKEKAEQLSRNVDEISRFVARSKFGNDDTPDLIEKGWRVKDWEQEGSESCHSTSSVQRGQRTRNKKKPRGNSLNYSYQSRSQNNFQPPFIDVDRSWHEGYIPKYNRGSSNVSSSSRGNQNYFMNYRPRSDFTAERMNRGMSNSACSMDKMSNVSSKSCYNDLTPNDLVTALSQCDKFSSTLLLLIDKYNYDHRKVKSIAEEHKNTFHLDGETVNLKPNIGFCKAHMEADGCGDKSKCLNLHICPKYVHNFCKSEDCLLGHSWKTNHNQEILKTHLISSLQVPTLNKLFMSILLDGLMDDDLQVCLDYNEEKCQKTDCQALHICLPFLVKLCPSEDKPTCKLNHNVLSKDLANILSCHGISINESPRDILRCITSSSQIKQECEKYTACMEATATNLNVKVSKVELQEFNPQMVGTSDSKESLYKNISEFKDEKKVLKTVWSNYFSGEVTIDEICYHSVEKYCKYEDLGCWRLHCVHHFHWQVREKGNHWVNLREYQVMALEKAFCDPQVGKVDVPTLDPSKLEPNVRGLLVTMQGRSQWEANFDAMELSLKTDNDQQVTSVKLELRRLCTEDTPNSIPAPCFFIWYFLDKNQKWIEYGLVDSTGDANLICNIKSDDIEKHRRQRPNSPLPFQSSKFSYMLDTMELKQINLGTNVARIIRRRPRQHLKEEAEGPASKSNVPDTWEPMEEAERVRRVTLAVSSAEYQKVSTFISQTGTYKIINIERVQNRFLYNAFQNKVQEMSNILKSKDAVDVRQLYHGTKPENVPKICEENFDWRLHGSSAGQAYGRGTYFSPLLSTSHSYTQVDPSGYRYIFIAQVAIGTMTQGNSAMVRPPINPQTSLPYDSTGNAAINASIIVKYDKQEYYPEYILTLA